MCRWNRANFCSASFFQRESGEISLFEREGGDRACVAGRRGLNGKLYGQYLDGNGVGDLGNGTGRRGRKLVGDGDGLHLGIIRGLSEFGEFVCLNGWDG